MRARRLMVGFVTAALVTAISAPVAVARSGETFGDPESPAAPSSSARDQFFAAGTGQDGGAEGARTITVTPDVDLVDGQAVTVDGDGFERGNITGILQCAKGLGLDGCDDGSVQLFDTGDDGTFSRTLHVEAIIETQAGDIDCRTFPAGCRLAANHRFSLTGAARADLGFDPDGPLEPPPTVAGDPAVDLVDGQVIQVTGAGFHTDDQVLVGQCPADFSNVSNDCENLMGPVPVTGSAIDTPYQVEAAFQIYRFEEGFGGKVIETIDCRTEPCVLAAVVLADRERVASTPLGFDPDAPLRPDMDVTVTPNVELVDGQTVTLSAVGYTPDGPVTVVECSLYSDVDGAGCELDRAQELTADADGSVTTTYAVNDELDTESGPIDCIGSGTCILVAVDRSVPIQIGRGYQFEYLNFAGGGFPTPADPAEPTSLTPQFTG